MEIIQITTLTQVKYWLEMGEIVAVKLKDGEGYVEKEKNKLYLTIQSKVGQSSTRENKWSKIDWLYNTILKKNEMYLIQGGKLIEDKASVLDKFVDFIRSVKGE